MVARAHARHSLRHAHLVVISDPVATGPAALEAERLRSKRHVSRLSWLGVGITVACADTIYIHTLCSRLLELLLVLVEGGLVRLEREGGLPTGHTGS